MRNGMGFMLFCLHCHRDDAGFFSDFYGNPVTGRLTGFAKDFTPKGFADRLQRAFKSLLPKVIQQSSIVR
jgi:hypothetical protein